jgi:hypothetical protein
MFDFISSTDTEFSKLSDMDKCTYLLTNSPLSARIASFIYDLYPYSKWGNQSGDHL